MLCTFVLGVERRGAAWSGVMDAAVPHCCADPVTVTPPIRQPL